MENKNVKVYYDILCKDTETNKEYTLGHEYNTEKEALENIPIGNKNELPLGIVKKRTVIDEFIKLEDMCFLCGGKIQQGTDMVLDKGVKYHLACYTDHQNTEKNNIKDFMEDTLKDKLDGVEKITYTDMGDCKQEVIFYKNGNKIKMTTSFDEIDLKTLQSHDEYLNEFIEDIQKELSK